MSVAASLVAAGQTTPAPESIVERNLSDINSWGFAATVPVGGQAHTVTTSTLATGLIVPGKSVSITFDTPGVIPYLCSPHPRKWPLRPPS